MGKRQKEQQRRTIQARTAWMQESAYLRAAIEARNERLAVFLVREMIRSREEAA
jgi:hypothetical protein